MKKKSLPSYSPPEPDTIPTLETIRRYEPQSVQNDDLLPMGRDVKRDFDRLLWTAKHADSDEVREKAGEMAASIVASIVRHGGNIKATLLPEIYKLHEHNVGYKKKWDEGSRQGTRQEGSHGMRQEGKLQKQALLEFVRDVLYRILPDDFISTGTDVLLAQKSAQSGAPAIDERLRKFTEWVEPKGVKLRELRSSYKRTRCESRRWSIRSQTISEIRTACVLNSDDFFEVFITPKARKMFLSDETHPFQKNFKLTNNPAFTDVQPPMPWSKNLRVMKQLLKGLLGPL
jgi:hypothetical protein